MEVDLSKNLWTFDGIGRKEKIYLIELDDEKIEKLWEKFKNRKGSQKDFYFKYVNPEEKEVRKIDLKNQEKREKSKLTRNKRKK